VVKSRRRYRGQKFPKALLLRLTVFQWTKLRQLSLKLEIPKSALIRKLLTPHLKDILPWGEGKTYPELVRPIKRKKKATKEKPNEPVESGVGEDVRSGDEVLLQDGGGEVPGDRGGEFPTGE
jgi:hypothetical protein